MTHNPRNFIILDIETDGIGSFQPGRQRPIQVSFFKCDEKGHIIKEYSEFVKGVSTISSSPNYPCEWTIEFINKNGIEMKKVIKDIEECIDDRTIIVGHNITFDLQCILNMYESSIIRKTPIICTMKQSVNYCKIPKKGASSVYGGYKWPRLNELATCMGVKVESNKLHDSRYDIELTKKSFFELTRRNVIKV